MARGGFLRRHRATIASQVALLVAAGAVISYAVAADGYQRHEAELNDGGIWVVNDVEGLFGRVNKPINELDTAFFNDEPDVPLDVLQQGAAVVGIQERAGVLSAVDPAAGQLVPGQQVSLPQGGQVEMHGGTLATLDPATGQVRAVHVDPVRGKPDLTVLDRQADPLEEVGARSVLTVTASGDVVAVTAAEDAVVRLASAVDGFEPAQRSDLPDSAGTPSQATAVGDVVVTLDQADGLLQVIGGPGVEVPPGAVLQQPGPAADDVLLATGSELLEVDLGSGDTGAVADGVAGRPAEPVRLGACAYGAWSGGLGWVAVRCGEGTVRPETLGARSSDLAFRVNRDQIVLNDNTTGAVWDIDEKPVRIDEWEAFTSTRLVESKDKKDEQSSDGDRRPPRAKPDDYGVRPGQTTVLHPLDNDSAPEGRILSIVAVDQPDLAGSQVTISPDGQTLQMVVPPTMARGTSFEYHIDDGRGLDASARVTIGPRTAAQNEPPSIRAGHEDRTWHVAHDGTIAVPVLADWRDDRDGDLVVVDSVQLLGGPATASARVTPDGRIRFEAGPGRPGGRAQVGYAVSDGHGGLVERQLRFDVQSYDDYAPHAPTAEPDVVRGEVGRPITVRPLLNDLPGADPSNPDAVLALGGEVAQQPGLRIDSDLETGELTVRAERPGTYFLDYHAAYGNSPLDRASIRVDARPRPRSELDPIAMPDSLTLHGQDPAMVDVLANDLDPAGGLLVVERAQAASGQLDVAVVAGRWLRISAAVATLDTPSQTVSYTISNGTVSGVEGQVTVSQKPEPKDTSPITAADRVVVRAGGSVTAAVLDNDVSPTGDKLSLVTDLDISAPGELEVHPPRGVTGDVGRAFVSGRVIRFVAPQRFAERDTVRVPHSVTDTDGASAAGELLVTIVPASAGNNAPQPPHLEGRAVAGGRATLRIPGSGVDPDGDSVTVTGIDTAPRLGRIAELGANGLVYEAFPGSAGTDEFHYTVTDSRGATAAGLARVVIVPPGRPQAPLAVDDRVLAAPGRTVHVDAIANDFVGTGEGVRVALQGRVGGASYDSGTDLVDIVVPEDVGAPSVQAVYSVDNGLDSSLATITVRAVEGYNNPPVVYDAYGVADDSEAVEIDVLEDAYDPDGDADDLVVVDVFHPTATFTDTSVKVERGDAPQVVPFRVEDADGAPAVASLYVPATGTGVPYVKDGAFIEVGTNGTVTGRLSDYVVSPSGEKVRLAGGDAAFAAPDQADAEVIDDQTFTLSGTSDYVGPGALLLRVTTRAGTARGATTTLLTVPAQIGRPKPVLTCPEVPFEVVQGGEITLDIPSLCNVYTADPGEAEGLAYDVAWVDQPSGLDLGAPGSGRVTVAASGGARAGTEAVLEVRAGDSDPRQVRVRVVEAPPPRLLPVTVQDLEPGESRTIDLAPYLLAGVADPEKTLLSVERVGPGDASAQRSGRTQVTLRGGPRGGSAAFRVVMSDVDDPDAGPERRAEGRLEFEVGAVPDAPTDVFARSMDDPSEMNIYFVPGNDNGSPVTRYLVKNLVTGRVTPCAGDGCLVENLKVGRDYNFAVAAVNKFGQGPWSPPSIMVVAGDKPLPPRNVTLQSRDDGVMTVGWSAPEKNGDSSATVTKYVVTVGGRSTSTDGTARSATVGGISNQNPNRVTVVAKNAVGFSDPTEVVPGWHGLGTPEVPTGVAVSDRGSGTSDSTTLDISWRAAAPNGPGETRYTVEVSRNDGAFRTAPGCDKVTALTCPQSVPYDGAILAYRVIAFNDPAADNAGGGEAPRQSSPSAPAKFEAIGTPQAWGSWSVVATGEDNQVHLTAPVPDSRGADSVVTISVGPQGESVERSIPSGAEIDRTLWTGTDDVVSTVTLQLCNERKCNTPVSKQVQSYGELTSDHIHVAGGEGQAGSRVVHWTVTTNGNGRPTTLHYRLPNGNVLTKAVPSGSTQTTVSFDTGDYEKTVRLEAWLQDAIPRRTREESADGTSGSPSPLGVNLTRNPCGGTDQPACKSGSGGGGGLFACSGTETCSNAMVSVTGIVAGDDTVTCETSYGLDVRPDEESFAVNGTKAVASYPHEGGTVQASCSSAKYSQSGSDALGWPDDRTSPSARAASYGP